MEGHTHTSPIERKSRVEKLTSGVLMATAFLLPIFFIPSGLFSLPFAKSILAYVGIIASLILFVFSILETGRIKLPKNPIFYAAFVIPLVFLISSLASSAVTQSIIGYGFETGTFALILLMIAFMFLVSTVYSTRERIFNSYLLFLVSFGIVALLQVIRLIFGAETLTFGVLSSSVSNIVGSWNDLGVFFAVSLFLALATLEMLPLSRMFRGMMYAALVISAFFLMIVNFITLWYVIATFSLALFVYVLLTSRDAAHDGSVRHMRISYTSLAVLLVAIVFIFAGDFLGSELARMVNVSNLEVRPSWKATLEIAQRTLGENALLGSGPNTFHEQWLKWKPAGINLSAFWNTDFSYGIGLIPTFVVTTGILGLLAWLAFFGIYLYMGTRIIFASAGDHLSRYFMLSSFFVSLFLWVMLITYVPSISIIMLAFFFTGLFLATAYNSNLLGHKHISFYQNSKMGFVSVLTFVFILVLAVGAGYYATRNFVSSMYFQKSLTAASAEGNLDAAEAHMRRAIALRGSDIFYRTLSEIKILQLNALLSRQDLSQEELRNRFQLTLGDAVNAGLAAVAAGPTNYQNHIALGRIYESVVPPPFQIEGAYTKAKESYDRALALNPKSPEILLLLSRLEVANRNLDGARTFANRAIGEKPNYVDAHFLLSQIEVAGGNIKKAISSVESATFLAPDNAGLYFQLGLLKYNDGDFQGASQAFERALAIVPNYANAKYFLGLSYSRLNRKADAVKQFEDLVATNPDNEEVRVILGNLRAGRDPFANITPPLDNQPEKRDNPPVNQE